MVLQDKDYFIDFYRVLLAKRLLADKSQSRDSERNLISVLKAQASGDVVTCNYNEQ
jgi:hypothetical protein